MEAEAKTNNRNSKNKLNFKNSVLFLKNIPKLAMDTLLWTFFSYLSILINISILILLKYGTIYESITKLDIISSILATNVCFLIGTSYEMYKTKTKKRDYFYAIIILVGAISIVISTLFTVKSLNDINIDLDMLFKIVMFLTIVTIFIKIVSFYDDDKAKNQEYANKSREKTILDLEGIEFKL